MDVIDMHNHFITPEVIDFLAREGKYFATKIVERDGRRFFMIQEKAMRPIDGPISDAHGRIAAMDRAEEPAGRLVAGRIVRTVPDVSGRGRSPRSCDRSSQQRRDGGSESERP